MKKLLVIINTILLLVVVVFSVNKEEKNLKKESFLLEIAPLDPRSLFQGDYMILDYVVSQGIEREIYEMTKSNEKNSNLSKNGFAVLKIKDQKIAQFERITENLLETEEGEIVVRYTKGSDGINLGIDSYLFQEGRGEEFERARYVEVVNPKSGELRIKNLLDEDFQVIK